MSGTTEVVDFSDLYTDFIGRARAASSSTATIGLAKRYINTALKDMHISPGSKLPWANRRGMVITHAPYSTGTVSVSASARTTLTGSGTLWNTAVPGFGFNNMRAGGKIKLSGTNEIYVTAAPSSDTAGSIETVYTGDALTDAAYTYFEDEYALASDFLKFVDVNMFSTDMGIPLIGGQDFRYRFGRNDTDGKPKIATHIQIGFSGSTTPQHRVVFNPYPDAEYSIPYWYVTSNLAVTATGVEQVSLVNDTDEPIVPRHCRHAIVFHALYHFYRDYKDDTRSQEAKLEYVELMKRLLGDTAVGSDRARFIVASKARQFRQRFDVGDAFNTLRDRIWR